MNKEKYSVLFDNLLSFDTCQNGKIFFKNRYQRDKTTTHIIRVNNNGYIAD